MAAAAAAGAMAVGLAACEPEQPYFGTSQSAGLQVSLKGLDYGDEEAASGGTVRQTATLAAGISSDKARELNKFIKGLGLKGIQSQAQGDELRVTGKKRDDLQAVISALKEGDFGVPLSFGNFRD